MRIMRIPWLALFLTLCTALIMPLAALAGGWSVTTLDRSPTDIKPGEPFSIGFMVRQHGDKPMAGLKPVITVINPTTGERVTATAAPEGVIGHYVATLTLPSAGAWTWEIAAFGEPAKMSPLQVGAPAPASEPPVARADPWLLPGLAVAALIALCAGGFALGWTRRGRAVARA